MVNIINNFNCNYNLQYELTLTKIIIKMRVKVYDITSGYTCLAQLNILLYNFFASSSL